MSRSTSYLGAKGVPDAEVAAELLAARLLKTGRGFLAQHLESEVDAKFVEAMRRGLARLAKGEPIQYVLGEWDFRTLTLKCDRRALIPRPETEELVTRVLKKLRSEEVEKWSGGEVEKLRSETSNLELRTSNLEPRTSTLVPLIVDVGTGTGAIILSLAKEFEGEAIFIGTDVSEDAVALARENAERCGLSDRVKFAVADGLDDFDEPQSVDIIVSNPPYIESTVCEKLDRNVRDYEPRLALDGGPTGLDFYDRYLADALNLLKPGGSVFFEIGENQGEALRKLMTEYGFENIRIEKDYAEHDRYATATLP